MSVVGIFRSKDNYIEWRKGGAAYAEYLNV